MRGGCTAICEVDCEAVGEADVGRHMGRQAQRAAVLQPLPPRPYTNSQSDARMSRGGDARLSLCWVSPDGGGGPWRGLLHMYGFAGCGGEEMRGRAVNAELEGAGGCCTGKGKEWGICPYRPPADQCLILQGHARRWNSQDPGLSVLYVSTEPVSSPLLLSRADTKDRTRAPDGVKAMHPPPYR